MRTTKTKKRRGCSVLSLVTLVPLLFIFSLFSTLLCPPPSHPQSQFSRLAFNSFGLGKDQHSSLHQTLCYPAYQYHDKVLEPYVYPALEDVQAKIQAHPVYTDKLEPGYQAAKATAERVWNGPVKPVVDRIARGARKFHLTHIQPRLPYLRAKLNELTAPVAHRLAAARAHVCAQYKTHAAPHVKVAAKNAQALYAQAEAHFHTAAGHPLTKQAGRHAHTAFRVTKDHSHKAYVFSKPHVVRGWHFTAHHSQHTVLPRVAQGLEIAADYMTRGLRIVKR